MQCFLQRQVDMNLLMLFMALHCHLLPMLFHYAGASEGVAAESSLQLSRAASVIMVIAYFAYLVFQLWTHRQLFEDPVVRFLWFWNDEANLDSSNVKYVNSNYHHAFLQENEEEGDNDSDKAVIGFWSGCVWLVGMTVIIAVLSEYVVQTIEVIHFFFFFERRKYYFPSLIYT